MICSQVDYWGSVDSYVRPTWDGYNYCPKDEDGEEDESKRGTRVVLNGIK